MAQFNYLSILGKVESAPVTKTLTTGTNITEFTLGWEDSYIAKNGAKTVNKFAIEVTLWDALLKKLDAPLKAGDEIILEGKLRSSSWGPEGQKKTKHTITASNITVISSPSATPKLDAVKKVLPQSTVKTPQDDGVNFVDEMPF